MNEFYTLSIPIVNDMYQLLFIVNAMSLYREKGLEKIFLYVPARPDFLKNKLRLL